MSDYRITYTLVSPFHGGRTLVQIQDWPREALTIHHIELHATTTASVALHTDIGRQPLYIVVVGPTAIHLEPIGNVARVVAGEAPVFAVYAPDSPAAALVGKLHITLKCYHTSEDELVNVARESQVDHG